MQIFVSLSLNVVLLFLLSIKYMLNDSKFAMFVVLKAKENDLIFYLLALQSFHLPKLTFLFFPNYLFCRGLLHLKCLMFFHLLEPLLLC